MSDDETPTILPENVQRGMVLQFGGELVDAFENGLVTLWAAEVEHIELPDGLGDLGFWVRPVEEDHAEVYVPAIAGKHYPIIG